MHGVWCSNKRRKKLTSSGPKYPNPRAAHRSVRFGFMDPAVTSWDAESPRTVVRPEETEERRRGERGGRGGKRGGRWNIGGHLYQ